MTTDATAIAEEGAVGTPPATPPAAAKGRQGMQDMTSGPITRHLLKTTSFMLVTMIFQTLYFLIDL